MHGLYLAHRGSGLALHVRAWSRAGDEAALVVVAATFRYDTERRVREWFISDGGRGASLALLHPDDAPTGVLADCEAVADSVRFG